MPLVCGMASRYIPVRWGRDTSCRAIVRDQLTHSLGYLLRDLRDETKRDCRCQRRNPRDRCNGGKFISCENAGLRMPMIATSRRGCGRMRAHNKRKKERMRLPCAMAASSRGNLLRLDASILASAAGSRRWSQLCLDRVCVTRTNTSNQSLMSLHESCSTQLLLTPRIAPTS